MNQITEKSIGIDGEVFPDRRAALRRRTLKGAALSFNKGFGAMECVVRNESRNGALLVFGDTLTVPAVFDLAVNGTAGPRAARVRWRSRTTVGVEFV